MKITRRNILGLPVYWIAAMSVSRMNQVLVAPPDTALNQDTKSNPLQLWYDKPALAWVEALPVGNGFLGAMVFGAPAIEHIQLNETTVWAGSPYRNDNPAALAALPQIRDLIFEEKWQDAQKLAEETIKSPTAQGMPFQTAGDLFLSFSGHDEYTDLVRSLDLQNAVASTTYKVNGVRFTREVFASLDTNAVYVHLTAELPEMLNFSISLTHPSPTEISAVDGNTLVMTGTSSSHQGVEGKLKFEVHTRALAVGGTVTPTQNSLVVSNASEVTVVITIGTNFENYGSLALDASKRAEKWLTTASKTDYASARQAHIKRYQHLFSRLSLNLGETPSTKNSTDLRLTQFSGNEDPALVSLLFQYGRYLLISSSQPGGQPANLQGIWCDSLDPAWNSKYTCNINLEMNYWPSEVTNLSETNDPLIQLVRDVATTGQETAKVMYGANGWVLHHNTDIWRFTGAIDGDPGLWPMGGAWLCQHLWEKYIYHGDKQYLESVYPILKGATEFFQSFLIEEPTHGWLVVSPSLSPENAPYSVRQSWTPIAAGVTLDNQLLFDLYTKTITAAAILGLDPNYISELKRTLDRLPPMQIGHFGQLQEWLKIGITPMITTGMSPICTVCTQATRYRLTEHRNSSTQRALRSCTEETNQLDGLWAGK